MFVGEGDIGAACTGTGWRAAVALVAMVAAVPAWAGDFTAGTLDPVRSLVGASHSSVAPVSPTLEQFNETPAHIGDAEAKDASIAAALSINDVFGVAAGSVEEFRISVEAEMAHAEDPARLSADVSGPLSIANGLTLPTLRELMSPPLDLLPDDGGAGPVALNASGLSLEAADHLLEKVDVRRHGPRTRRHGMQ